MSIASVASGPARAADDAGSPARSFEAAAGVGYAFRSADDHRTHGLAAHLSVDTPHVAGWGLRVEGLGLAIVAGATATTSSPVSLVGGGLLATYVLDDTDTRAVLSVGPFAGASFDGATSDGSGRDNDVSAVLGVQSAIELRGGFGPELASSVVDVVGWQARVAIPWVLVDGGAWSPPLGAGRWPLQAMATIGLCFGGV